MRKKIFAIIMAVALLAFSMAACGNGGNGDEGGGSEKTEITFWAHLEEAWKASYDKVAQDFMKENPDIIVKTEYFPYDEFEAKVQSTLLSNESGADVVELWGGWGIDYAPARALAEMPQEFANQIVNDSYPPTIGSLMSDGKLYGMPLEFNIEFGGMLVNKKLQEENGFSDPTTWDQLIEQGSKGTIMNGDVADVRGFDFTNWDSVTYLFTSMILNKGATYWSEEEGFTLSKPEAVESFQTLTDYVTKDKVTDLIGLTGGEDLEGYQMLFADKAIYVPRGPWAITEGENVFNLGLGTDFDYIKMPTYEDGVKFAAETGWSLGVNKKSKKQEAAFKFIEYFFSDEVLLEHNIACRMIPPKATIANSPEFIEAMPFMGILVPTLENASYIGYFNTDRLKDNLNDTFVNFCDGKFASAEEAMKKLEETLNSLD
jgi:multiple sugar transport system substrate-binding protein